MGGGGAPRSGTVFEASAALQAPLPGAAEDARAVVVSAASVDAHWGRWWGRATDGREKKHRPAPDVARRPATVEAGRWCSVQRARWAAAFKLPVP